MSRRNTYVIDRLLADTLSGREKIRALIIARDGSIQRWAGQNSLYPIQASQTINNVRPYPEIRDLIAEDFGLPRDEVDELIEDGEGKTNGAEAGPGQEAQVA